MHQNLSAYEYRQDGPIILDYPPSGLPRLPVSNMLSTPSVKNEEPSVNMATPPSAGGAPNNNTRSYIPVGSLSESQNSESYYPKEDLTFLEKHQWIRTKRHDSGNIQILVLPQDVQRASIHSPSEKVRSKLKSKLKGLMARIDNSDEAWHGSSDAHPTDPAMGLDYAEDESLWYIFNTLQNPDPSSNGMQDYHARHAMEALLGEFDSVRGLKTKLYPYQQRSAATMVQREAQPAMVLDSRLQALRGPTGSEFYYDKMDGTLLKEKRLYSEACGGILAESMGCGKTLISLAVILATRGHMPQIPIEYQTLENSIRKKTATLKQMAAATIGRFSVPWRPFFESLEEQGQTHENCIKACRESCGSYIIPPETTKHPTRNCTSPYTRDPARHLRLCSGTIVIVPQNLVDHWESEIKTHTSGLKFAVLRQSSDQIPTEDELLDLDIVLFAKNRFELEVPERKHHLLKKGQTSQYESPLLGLHWLRVIVDEGHNVAGHGTRLTEMLQRLQFERRWIISGTPSPGLYGLEVKLASHEVETGDIEQPEDIADAVLQDQKRMGSAIKKEKIDLDKLRDMVIKFLDLKPWSNSHEYDPADWTTYIMPIRKDGRRRKAPSLRATLQSLVVRHQMNVIEKEVPLPKLYNKVTYLEPTFYDKLSINMFLFAIAVNAITSERQGPDYMFDPKSRKHVNEFIENLRQAGFWWAGSTKVQDSINTALKYLEANQDHNMSLPDIRRLTQGIHIATTAVNSPHWQGFTRFAELGVFVQDFPEFFRGSWAIENGSCNNPLLMGVTQARQAQQFVTANLRSSDPTTGLSGAGIKARGELAHRQENPSTPDSANKLAAQRQLAHSTKPSTIKAPKQTFKKNIFRSLPEESPLKQTRLVGVASAKLRYLLDKVLEFHETEKIIIFYDHQNTAFWVAEAMELMSIEFRIYASELKQELRTEYLNLFRESQEVRVLLMDLRQASHGLHIAQASRVFIINPIWQPNIESQAIKRAHRIGQKRPVYVETLVLENTPEHHMLNRRKQMSDAEMQLAEKNLLDDTTMSDTIQNEPYLPMEDESSSGMARLHHPTGFFDRHKLPIPDDEENGHRSPMKRKKRDALPSNTDLASTSSPGATTPLGKRPRIGFAEHAQVMGDESSTVQVPEVPDYQASVPSRPRVGFASGSPSPPSRDHGSKISSSIMITSSAVTNESNNVERRVSMFGPYE